MFGFIDTAKVYVPNGTDGAYDSLAATLTSCRLAVTNVLAAQGAGRAEPEAGPRLLWTDAYEMPEAAQVEVGGKRFNVKLGTYDAIRGPSGAVAYRRCDVAAL